MYFHIILDLNDEPPRFPQKEYTFSLPESQRPGPIQTAIPPAVDKDTKINGIREYRLVNCNATPNSYAGFIPANNPTLYNLITSINGSSSVQANQYFALEYRPDDRIRPITIKLMKELDYEVFTAFNCSLEASDTKSKGQMVIHILITDINDQSMSFQN